MQLEVGAVLDGRVSGITKYGAFVTLPDGKSGLVHISEIANTYVNDVREHVSEGLSVKVKIIGIGENGKINLSIKKAEEQPPRRAAEQPPRQRVSFGHAKAPASDSFEDKLKQFMQDSDSKISGLRRQTDRKNNSRRKRT